MKILQVCAEAEPARVQDKKVSLKGSAPWPGSRRDATWCH
jgi:hypothetical protein